MKTLMIIFSVLFSAQIFADGKDSFLVGTFDGNKVYLYTNSKFFSKSKEKEDIIYHIWIRSEYPPENPDKIEYIKIEENINVTKHTYCVPYLVILYQNGSMSDSEHIACTYKPIAPDSLTSEIEDFIIKKYSTGNNGLVVESFSAASSIKNNDSSHEAINLPFSFNSGNDETSNYVAPPEAINEPSFMESLAAAIYIATHKSNPTSSDAISRMRAARVVESFSGYNFSFIYIGIMLSIIIVIALVYLLFKLIHIGSQNEKE